MIRHLPLTRGRVLALAIGVPPVLAVVGFFGVNWVALAGQGSYPVRLNVPVTGSTAQVSTDSGDLTVGQAPGHRLRLTGTAHYSLIRSKVTWRRTRSGVFVSSSCRVLFGNCGFHFNVTIPAGARALLSCGSGDMTLNGLAGHVSASCGSGNLSATGLSGSASLGAGSGDIGGTALSGAKLTLSDGSGNITVGGLSSPYVHVTDGSGDVVLTFTKVPTSVYASVGSGNVTLILPRGVLYRVDAHTDSGNSNVNVQTSSVAKYRITVKAGSGDINIGY